MLLVSISWLVSCEEYLDKTPDADVTDIDVFGTYQSFQGFADVMYGCIFDQNHFAWTCGAENGDHTIAFAWWNSAKKFAEGNYWLFFNNWQTNYWVNNQWTPGLFGSQAGVYIDGWKGMRIANLCLQKLPMLVGTDEEKDLIAGQAYFFRALLHWEIALRWGGIPYADTVYKATDDLKFPRPNFQETVERIVKDFDRAAELLPVDWDDTQVGSRRPGLNTGRATKGAALAYKARALLFAGSPLMVAESGGDYAFDEEYMKRSANAAYEVIKLADKGIYELVPFEDYWKLFASKDCSVPWTTETIFGKITDQTNGSNDICGSNVFISGLGRIYAPAKYGGVQNWTEQPVQNLIDEFETVNGLPINDPVSGYDPMNPWNGRDPRLRESVYIDRDMVGYDPGTKVEMFKGGVDRAVASIITCYYVKKFWPIGVNKFDQEWTGFNYFTPMMRLADVYLMYAEAVNEFAGPFGSAEGASLTAADALNRVRNRANMPDIASKFLDKDSFRERVRNERSVELCFEGSRWNDMRRWYIAHLPESKTQYTLEFDKDHTYFNKVVVFNRIFDQKHYWMPFPKTQTELYPAWSQNPGW
jgi:starch-binding outer membrane protein, SusD/RagB family